VGGAVPSVGGSGDVGGGHVEGGWLVGVW
jgi:hypothetical protein